MTDAQLSLLIIGGTLAFFALIIGSVIRLKREQPKEEKQENWVDNDNVVELIQEKDAVVKPTIYIDHLTPGKICEVKEVPASVNTRKKKSTAKKKKHSSKKKSNTQ